MTTPPPPPWRSSRVLLGLIFLLGLGLRLTYIYQVSGQPLFRNLIIDLAAYDDWAQKIAAGDWLGSAPFYQDPLYPYFLAVLYSLFGRSLTLVCILQAVISAAASLPLYGAGRIAFNDRRAGLVAAALWATYKVDFFFVGQIEKTSTGVALSILALWLILRFIERPVRVTAVAAGLCAGLLLVYRGNYLLVMPVVLFAAGLFARRRANGGRRASGSALAALALAFLFVPVATTARNYAVSGEFIVTTAQGGVNLYVGNWRGNRWGVGQDPPFARRVPLYEQDDFRAEAERRSGKEFTDAELSRFWSREAMVEIAADPGLAAARLGRKLLLIVNFHEVPDNLSFDFYRTRFSWLLKLPLPAFWLAGPLGLTGLALGLRRRKGRLLALYLGLYVVTLLMTYIVSRYRMPLVPPLLLFAGYAVVEGAELIRRREWKALAPALVVLIVAAGLGFPRWRHPSFAQSYEKLGNAWARERNWAEAIAAYQRSLAINPKEVGALTGLGLAYEATNRFTEARQAFAAAVEAGPDNAIARYLLGRSLEREGKKAEAEAEYKRAVELDPRSKAVRVKH